jgi:hypothetical protein
MKNKLGLERIESLRGKRAYEETKAAKLGFCLFMIILKTGYLEKPSLRM